MGKEKKPRGWLLDLIKDGEKYAGSESALAGKVGVTPPAVRKWKQGGDIKSDYLLALQRYVDSCRPPVTAQDAAAFIREQATAGPGLLYAGGLITHAGGLQHAQNKKEEVEAVGHLQGNTLSLVAGQAEMVDFSTLFQQSPWWSATNPNQPIQLMLVRGDAMEPTYPNGSWIAVRPPAEEPKNLNGAPVVLMEAENLTLKFLHVTADKKFVTRTANPKYPTTIVKQPQIVFVVLGHILPKPAI